MAVGALVYVLIGYVTTGISHGGTVLAFREVMGVTALTLVGVATRAAAAAVLLRSPGCVSGARPGAG